MALLGDLVNLILESPDLRSTPRKPSPLPASRSKSPHLGDQGVEHEDLQLGQTWTLGFKYLVPANSLTFLWFNGKPISWQQVKVLTSKQNAPKNTLPQVNMHPKNNKKKHVFFFLGSMFICNWKYFHGKRNYMSSARFS